MTKRFWTIVFILVITQVLVFGYLFNRLALLNDRFEQYNSEQIILSQQMLKQDMNQVIQVIRGLMIQVEYLTHENGKNKPKKIKQTKDRGIDLS